LAADEKEWRSKIAALQFWFRKRDTEALPQPFNHEAPFEAKRPPSLSRGKGIGVRAVFSSAAFSRRVANARAISHGFALAFAPMCDRLWPCHRDATSPIVHGARRSIYRFCPCRGS
jgi:hypothetical protein